jgi:hypothetical protein
VKNDLRLIIFLVLGAVVGSILNQVLIGVGAPEWLTRTQSVGLNPPPDPDSFNQPLDPDNVYYRPTYLDLAIFRVTIGFSLELSLCSVLGLALGLVLYKKLQA